MSTDSRPGSSAGELPENLRASDIMVPVPRTCSPFSTITEAALILKDQGLGMVPVVDLGKPIGIVTDRDVAAADAGGPESGTAAGLGRHGSSDPDRTGRHADRPDPGLMADSGAPTLLVTDAEGLLLGAISRTDVAARLPGGSMASASDSTHFVEVDRP